MARRLVERRVDNRVFDDDLAQPGPYDPEILLLRLNFQELLDHRLKWVFARRLNRAVMTISFWRKEFRREQRKRTHLTCIAQESGVGEYLRIARAGHTERYAVLRDCSGASS